MGSPIPFEPAIAQYNKQVEILVFMSVSLNSVSDKRHLPLGLVVADQRQCAMELSAVYLNGPSVAFGDLIDWNNGCWRNHCPQLRLMGSGTMHTIVVCRCWCNFLALVIVVQHSPLYAGGAAAAAMNVPFAASDDQHHLYIRHPIASMTVFAHFHAVPALGAQALVIAHVAAAA